jgi:DNA repair exonuclease SbcCD ATPase subunit
MKIDSLDIEEFADGEHRGMKIESVSSDSLLLRGGSRTGKTLSFNAVLYNLLGAKHTIDLAAGRQNKVELGFTNDSRFFRGNPRSVYERGDETLEGSNASETFSDDLGDTTLLKSLFVHSHIGKMPLDELTRSQRTRLIRSVTNSELEQKISRLEDAEEQLGELVIETKDTKRRLSEEESDLDRQIRDLESQKKKYDRLGSQIESGELAELSQQLKKDEQVETKLDDLFKEKEGLRKRLRKLHRKKRKQENYESEVNDIIAEAVNDFVCPTCDRRITTEKAKNRIQRGYCPYCGRNHSLDGLKQRLSKKIEESDDLLDDLKQEIEELQDQRDEVSTRIDELKDDRPELEELDGFTKRRLDNYDHNIQQVQDHVQEELESISTSLEELESDREDLNERVEDIKQKSEVYSEAHDHASELVEELTEESFEAGIGEFSEAWEEAYNQMNSNLQLGISISEEGRIQFPGRNNLREYDRGGNLSGSELHLLNISFACTLAQFATESEVIKWDTVVLDEPFSNLQEEENRDAALEYILSLDKQMIVTTSNTSIDTRFDQVEILKREPLQTKLGDFL